MKGYKKTVCLAAYFFIPVWFFSLVFSAASQAGEKKSSPLSARSAAIIRTSDGAILYGKKLFLKLPPASTVKVMTVLIALEDFNFDKEVLISPFAANIEPTKAGLIRGEKYAMRDLIKASLISSANDAAIAIAEEIAGAEERFAGIMNEKAKKLGMMNTVFVNSTGLPGDKKDAYTTSYDLTILMREAARNQLFVKIANLKEAAIKGSDGRTIYLKNHNKMLWRKPGIIGKTGYTISARHCFVGLDTSEKNPVAFAILASRSPWHDVDKILEMCSSLEK